MPSVTKSTLLGAVRVALVVAGVGVAALVVQSLAAMPPPPPDSDGFAHGMAFIVGSVIVVVSLAVATVGVALPTLLGRDDPLGFTRWQRLALKAAGTLVGGGFLVALAFGLLSELQFGFVLWLGFLLLAVAVVFATLVWWLAARSLGLLYQYIADATS